MVTVCLSALCLVFFAQGADRLREPELTPAQVATRLRSLAIDCDRPEVLYHPSGPEALRHLSGEVVRLNRVPPSVFRRVGDALDAQSEREAKKQKEPLSYGFSLSVVCRLWFLLRYRHPRGDSLTRYEFTTYHQNIIAPSDDPKARYSFDYPWTREKSVWALRPFGLRAEGGVQSFRYMYEEFHKLPLRRDPAWDAR